MKRITLILLSICLLLSLESKAQTQDSLIAIPNPSFENWSNGSGYSVTVLFFSLPVYSSYTYPTSWDYPTYPVNENITYSGMNVNVNTNLPLLKVSNMSSGAVDGSHALKMQSFMLSDIISSTVYNLASSSLDPTLTSTVFPTVLSTGVVNIDQFLPLMYDITSSLGNVSQMLSLFNGVDINTLINGGVPLNGAIPGRLTGYYKYTSATSGDNGGILMLGTKYNTTTHQREVVGAGYNIALTDTSVYTPFELQYMPLSDIDPTIPYNEADSLILLLFSSANTTPQQGSALFLDHLQLWAQEEVIPEDTCSAVFNLTVNEVDTTHATLSWTYEGNPDHFEAEYGVQGFTHGNGTSINISNNSLSLTDLQPDTYYDVYVRCVCEDSLWGDWAMTNFHTDTLIPPVIIPDDTCSAVFNLRLIDVDTMNATIGWSFEGEPDHFEAEYGVQGFAQGSGTTVGATESFLHLSELQPDTYYDIYVRCVCDEDLFGEWAMINFHTDTLVPPVVIVEDTCSAIFNLTVSDVDTMHATLNWTYEGEPDHFEAEYGLQGFALGNGTSVYTNSNSLSLTDLQPDSYYDVYVRCVCNDSLWGDWSMTSFHTDTLVPPAVNPGDTTSGDTTGIQRFAANLLSVYPNPAHGQCVVQFTQGMPKIIRLYTIEGALIQEVIPTKEKLELTLPTKGIFILNCEMKEGTVVRKIVNQ